MARDWKCAKCGASNPETAFACQSCGMIRGSVVVPPMPPPSGFEPPRASAPPSAPPPPTQGPLWNAASAPATVARPRRGRRLPIGLLLFVGLVVVSGIYNYFNNANRSSSGEIDRGGELSVADLRVGDCFDLADPGASEVQQVTAHPCAESHQYEMLFAGDMTTAGYPTDSDFSSFVDQQCLPAFASYVGIGYESSALEISWFYPTSSGWGRGDRTVQCVIFDPQQGQITGSLKGAAR